jgi:hypothetical protein
MALHIDEAAFRVFERALEQAYIAGGSATIDAGGVLRDATGTRFIVRFDARNLRAEQWLKQHSSALVTRIVAEQRAAIRQHLEDGMTAGRNPRAMALDIAGRINADTGKREGGIVGLSDPQERAVTRARQELEAGDFAAYRQRKLRDARFDRTIASAENNGKPLTQEQIDKIINRYADRLLNLRGVTIARTEALASLHAAQHEALLQMIDTGKIRADQVTRIWDATGDRRTRFDHAVADGQETGVNGLFTIGGRAMKYPGDPAGGAAQVINCRCHVRLKFDWLKGVR